MGHDRTSTALQYASQIAHGIKRIPHQLVNAVISSGLLRNRGDKIAVRAKKSFLPANYRVHLSRAAD